MNEYDLIDDYYETFNELEKAKLTPTEFSKIDMNFKDIIVGLVGVGGGYASISDLEYYQRYSKDSIYKALGQLIKNKLVYVIGTGVYAREKAYDYYFDFIQVNGLQNFFESPLKIEKRYTFSKKDKKLSKLRFASVRYEVRYDHFIFVTPLILESANSKDLEYVIKFKIGIRDEDIDYLGICAFLTGSAVKIHHQAMIDDFNICRNYVGKFDSGKYMGLSVMINDLTPHIVYLMKLNSRLDHWKEIGRLQCDLRFKFNHVIIQEVHSKTKSIKHISLTGQSRMSDSVSFHSFRGDDLKLDYN